MKRDELARVVEGRGAAGPRPRASTSDAPAGTKTVLLGALEGCVSGLVGAIAVKRIFRGLPNLVY